jgi:Holliday junction resolvase-like predicted endonuclease
VNWAADWLNKSGYPIQANQVRQRFGSNPGWRGGT